MLYITLVDKGCFILQERLVRPRCLKVYDNIHL